MTFVISASMITAGMSALSVLMVVVAAMNIRVISEISVKECFDRIVSISAYSAVEFNSGFEIGRAHV